VEQDVGKQRHPASHGAQETKDGQARVAQYLEIRFHAHEHRRSYNQGRQDETHGNAIGNLLKAFDQRLLVNRFDPE
jgi:hypothetical protein